MKCEKCGVDYLNAYAIHSHQSKCKSTPTDIENIIKDYKEFRLSTREISKKYQLSFSFISKVLGAEIRNKSESLKISFEKNPRVLSEETKSKISKSRKQYLQKNPDKRKWIDNESQPSILFKQILFLNDISFVPEYKPLDDRFFSIDIAFPDKKIGIEINGNQHYDSKGNLKKYYQDRHDMISSQGWKLIEIKSRLIYNKNFIDKFILELKNDFNISNVDYSQYIKPNIDYLCVCGKKILKESKKCKECYTKDKLGQEEITKRIMLLNEVDFNKKGWVMETSKKLGISHTQLRRFIKKYFEKNV